MDSPLLRGHVLVSAFSQVKVERGTDNALGEDSSCVRSAFVDHGSCHVSDSFGQLAGFVGSSCRGVVTMKLQGGISLPSTAGQHGQSSVNFDTWNHRFAVCGVVLSLSCAVAWFHPKSNSAQSHCPAVRALAELDWVFPPTQ